MNLDVAVILRAKSGRVPCACMGVHSSILIPWLVGHRRRALLLFVELGRSPSFENCSNGIDVISIEFEFEFELLYSFGQGFSGRTYSQRRLGAALACQQHPVDRQSLF